jgi:hypothetical protein
MNDEQSFQQFCTLQWERANTPQERPIEPVAEDNDEDLMLSFVARALEAPRQKGVHDVRLDTDVVAALERCAAKTPAQVMTEREAVTSRIERWARTMWADGTADEWLADADAVTQQVSSTVCGPLLLELAKATGFQDGECVDILRHGAMPLAPSQRPQTRHRRCTLKLNVPIR